MKKILKKILFGDVEITEYSTLSISNDTREAVYLQVEKNIINVSQTHWVLCLHPIVFGVWLNEKTQIEAVSKSVDLKMYFCNSDNEKKTNKNAVAIIKVNVTNKIEDPNGTLFLLKLELVNIFHADLFRTHFLFNRYYKKPGFSFSQFKEIAAAYSFPRKVHLISFREDNYYNIFPMDLIGEIPSNNRYVFGLRHTNITLQKIIETKKIVMSEFPANYKPVIYELGKHHSKQAPLLQLLPFETFQSDLFKFYIPQWIESYKEIKIIKTMNLGSHMLLWGEAVNETILKQPGAHLHHIHFMEYFHQKNNGFAYQLI